MGWAYLYFFLGKTFGGFLVDVVLEILVDVIEDEVESHVFTDDVSEFDHVGVAEF